MPDERNCWSPTIRLCVRNNLKLAANVWFQSSSVTESLSIPQARKLVLLSQRLPPGKQTGSARAATLSAIEHLGYVQIDTISVVQRAHDHTLWTRNPRYEAAHLDELLADRFGHRKLRMADGVLSEVIT